MIGPGVAVDIKALLDELDSLRNRDVPTPKLFVSDRAQVVLPYHVLFDEYEEERLGDKSFGSTKSGIAPFYSDKYLKIGVQIADLSYEDSVRLRITRALELKNTILKNFYHKPKVSIEKTIESLIALGKQIQPYIIGFLTQIGARYRAR